MKILSLSLLGHIEPCGKEAVSCWNMYNHPLSNQILATVSSTLISAVALTQIAHDLYGHHKEHEFGVYLQDIHRTICSSCSPDHFKKPVISVAMVCVLHHQLRLAFHFLCLVGSCHINAFNISKSAIRMLKFAACLITLVVFQL